MDFFESISFPFRIWQAICLSPFILPQIPVLIPDKFRKSYFTKAVIILLLLFVIACSVNLYSLTKTTDLWIRVSFMVQTTTSFIATVIILVESFINREEQKKLLLQFDVIDSIFKQQIGIEIDYAREHQGHKNRLIRWVSLNFCTMIFSFPFSSWNTLVDLITAYPFVFFCILRQYQFVIFVDLIIERYRLLNELINKIYLDNLHRTAEWRGLFNVIDQDPVHPIQVDGNWQQIDKFRLLRQVRHVLQLLHNASRRLKSLSSISLIACCLSAFIENILYIYFVLEELFFIESTVDYFVHILVVICCVNDIRVLASACEIAVEEVWHNRFLNIS